MACYTNCNSCDGAGYNSCLSCYADSYLDNGECKVCDSRCELCNGVGFTNC